MGFIRLAQPKDTASILGLVRELADYVGAADEVVATEESLASALFGESPSVFAHVVEHESEVVGFSLWFLTFSTWLGKYGAWIDDLYIRPEFRGHGYGTALLKELQRVCVERGYGRMEWTVYDWNEPAIQFYKGLQAVPKDEFTVFRLDGEALHSSGRAGSAE